MKYYPKLKTSQLFLSNFISVIIEMYLRQFTIRLISGVLTDVEETWMINKFKCKISLYGWVEMDWNRVGKNYFRKIEVSYHLTKYPIILLSTLSHANELRNLKAS